MKAAAYINEEEGKWQKKKRKKKYISI